jgi:histidinol dehydrogenase
VIPIHSDGSAEFDAALDRICARGTDDLEAVVPAVREIIATVRRGGDDAVRQYVEKFEARSPEPLVYRDFDGQGALLRLDPHVREALELAAERIARYHDHERETGFHYEEDGVELGLRVRPLGRVGVYAPGGKARYPSSVLMTAIPARAAGVTDIVLATPAPDDRLFAAAHLSGVSTILNAGGAHAIAALAYGTSSLPRVDKIVGPGNLYVTCAKRLVFGDVAIDGIAGPSEILVVADEHADAALVAADLLSQAEHDEASHAVLVTTSRSLAASVVEELTQQLAKLPRQAIASAAMQSHGAALVVATHERLAEVASRIAAEHISLHLSAPADRLMEQVGAAGAALLGAMTPVAASDYFAGPSHVLPTGGAVRFGSPLGVYDFVARTSVIRYSEAALRRHGRHIVELARAEGLEGHARAVDLRLERIDR